MFVKLSWVLGPKGTTLLVKDQIRAKISAGGPQAAVPQGGEGPFSLRVGDQLIPWHNCKNRYYSLVIAQPSPL